MKSLLQASSCQFLEKKTFACLPSVIKSFLKEVISDCLSALENYDGSAPIISPSDSLIKYDDQKVIAVDRSTIKIVQTPQCFKKQFKSAGYDSSVILTKIGKGARVIN